MVFSRIVCSARLVHLHQHFLLEWTATNKTQIPHPPMYLPPWSPARLPTMIILVHRRPTSIMLWGQDVSLCSACRIYADTKSVGVLAIVPQSTGWGQQPYQGGYMGFQHWLAILKPRECVGSYCHTQHIYSTINKTPIIHQGLFIFLYSRRRAFSIGFSAFFFFFC